MSEVESKTVTWAIYDFPEKVKNEFMGVAKMEGKNMPRLLANILRVYINAHIKERGKTPT